MPFSLETVEQLELNREYWEAIARLLDDPSPVVRRELLAHFQTLGNPGCEFLRELSNGTNRVRALHARWYLMELKFADPANEFRGFIRSLGYELETGVFLLCRTVHPELDISEFCGQLDRIALRCRELMVEPLPMRERCKVISRVLFHEMGFRGNADHSTDPANSFLNRVLETRKGLPISLSILYLLVAERCAVPLEPVALPDHFMVGCYHDGPAYFIDAHDHGRILNADGLMDFLKKRQIPMEEFYLAPTTVRETLCWCCRNLAHHYDVANQPPLSRLFAGFVEEFESAYEENASP